MKKAAILSITAFYLLLTTGMFVCMVHCVAEDIITKPTMEVAGSMANMHHHCKNDKDCDCCKKHGNFIIKENLKPGYNVQFFQTVILIPHNQFAYFILNIPKYNNPKWDDSNALPVKSGRSRSIAFRSLLI